jgi:hypothetical protein
MSFSIRLSSKQPVLNQRWNHIWCIAHELMMTSSYCLLQVRSALHHLQTIQDCQTLPQQLHHLSGLRQSQRQG